MPRAFMHRTAPRKLPAASLNELVDVLHTTPVTRVSVEWDVCGPVHRTGSTVQGPSRHGTPFFHAPSATTALSTRCC